MNFDKKSDILTWIGEHFTDMFTGHTAVYAIITDILKTIHIPEKEPSFEEVNQLRNDIQKILKFYLNKWNK